MATELSRLETQFRRILRNRKDLRARIARMAVARIGARATRHYMQEGPRTRRPGETGKLIIQRQTLFRAVMGGPGSRAKLSIQGAVTKFVFTILVPYAAIHEFGGTIRLKVTSQMRSFFWAMFFQTGDEKWKAMALSKKREFIITMPKRAYLEPAQQDETPEVLKRAADIVFKFIDQALS